MKKLTKPTRIELPPACLFLDDFRELVEVAISENGRTIVRVDDRELGSLEELDQLYASLKSKKSRSFSIVSSDPAVSLRCDDSVGIITAESDSIRALGIAMRWQSIWKQRRLHSPIFLRFIMFGVLLLSAWWVGRVGAFWWQFVVGFTVFGSMFVGAIYGFVDYQFRSVLMLSNRMESPGFFERNKDRLWVAVVSALAAGAVTLLVERSPK